MASLEVGPRLRPKGQQVTNDLDETLIREWLAERGYKDLADWANDTPGLTYHKHNDTWTDDDGRPIVLRDFFLQCRHDEVW